MKVIRHLDEIRPWADRSVKKPGTSGLVPTLGALHEGHESLIKKARSENKRVVVSVFVNPLQFRKKQYLLYPRDLKSDIEKAAKAGADVLFAPSATEMYQPDFGSGIAMPAMFKTLKRQKLEWHYKGVLAVVLKLFQLVRPDRVYFGQKDPHQLALIERMVKDFNIPVVIRSCPTVRDENGLALSSRNALLTAEEKRAAAVIYRALKFGRKETKEKGTRSAQKTVVRIKKLILEEPLARLEHIEIVDAKNLRPLTAESAQALVYASVRIGGKRLTDNIRFRLK